MQYNCITKEFKFKVFITMHVHVLNDNANIYFKKGTHTIDFLNSIS